MKTTTTTGRNDDKAAQLLSRHNVAQLFHSTDVFLFDCDGVIWKRNKLLDGVAQTLEWLRSQGKMLVFVTNNASKSRRQYALKFLSLGIQVSEADIFSSSFAVAMYLKRNDFPREKKVYVIGGRGVLEELELAGFIGIGGQVSEDDDPGTVQLKANSTVEQVKSVGAVVVELDRHIDRLKLEHGSLCIRENEGCLFIATDEVQHTTSFQELQDAGTLATARTAEREPVVVGKPSTLMMDLILQRFNISGSRMCMVGDRLDTDIMFGKNGGCKTLLVLSGQTEQSTLDDPLNHIQPDYYTRMMSDIFELLRL